jgi:hypothetical protein
VRLGSLRGGGYESHCVALCCVSVVARVACVYYVLALWLFPGGVPNSSSFATLESEVVLN